MPRYRLYVGPAYVRQYSAKIKEAGYRNVLTGTEHIHFDSSLDLYAIPSALYSVLGYLPAMRDFQVITPKTGEAK